MILLNNLLIIGQNLSRSLSVEIDGNEGVENIRDPSRNAWRYISTDGEGGCDGHEEDI